MIDDPAAGLTLQPTELQPLTARQDIAEEISALAQLEPGDPAYSAHLSLALAKLASRIDRLEAQR